ncbi:MAG: hypothetical protein J0M02_19695 [Planctomycetes bacterium]|nr:hypothetical protein [Planctomycetota bacterium]
MFARLLITTFCLTLTPLVVAQDLSIVRTFTGWRDGASFKRISEYFDGKENTGRETVLRTHPEQRTGYYFLVRVANPGAPLPVRFMDAWTVVERSWRRPLSHLALRLKFAFYPLLACAALSPLVALLTASLLGKVQANWPAMAWIPAAILSAWWLHAAAGGRARRIAIIGSIVAAAGAIAIAAVPTLRLRWPDLPPSVPERKLAGYATVAAEVDRLLALQPDRTCTLTGAYDLAAELAWHNRHLPRPVCARFGRRASQYDLWPGLDGGKAGWDAVWAQELDRADRLDGDLRDRLPRGLAADFASLDQPRLVRVQHGGRTWRIFLVVRLHGFDGSLDSADQPPTTPKYSR